MKISTWWSLNLITHFWGELKHIFLLIFAFTIATFFFILSVKKCLSIQFMEISIWSPFGEMKCIKFILIYSAINPMWIYICIACWLPITHVWVKSLCWKYLLVIIVFESYKMKLLSNVANSGECILHAFLL